MPLPLRARGPTYLVFLRVVSDGLQMAHEEFQCFIVVSREVPDLGGREEGHAARLSQLPLALTPQRGSHCYI